MHRLAVRFNSRSDESHARAEVALRRIGGFDHREVNLLALLHIEADVFGLVRRKEAVNRPGFAGIGNIGCRGDIAASFYNDRHMASGWAGSQQQSADKADEQKGES